jgi:hypothetical protein
MDKACRAHPLTPDPLQEQVWDTLVCLYTCERHRPFLDEFYRSPVGRYLKQLPDSTLLEVYADPGIERSFHGDGRLILQTPERYDSLSLKTFEMMRYCAGRLRFRRLLKIDVTVVQTRFEGPEYEGRVPIDMGKLLQFLKTASPERDYDGFRLFPAATRENARKWASKKGRSIDYERLFGDGPMVPFFGGKAYFVSHAFARFIAEHGAAMAREHAEHFLGSEDVMVARLHQKFRAGTTES